MVKTPYDLLTKIKKYLTNWTLLDDPCLSRGERVSRCANEPEKFGKLKARLADAFLSIGAVTGFGYGCGFETATMRGSDYIAERENFGGLLGGISTGEPMRLLASIKPTTSIGEVAKKGRHDPCIVPRVIPVLEAMTACVLCDALLEHRARNGER